MNKEEKKLIESSFIPALLVILMWLVKILEWQLDFSLSFLGIHPLHADGLPGIVLSPFLHGDWKHLMANSIPMLVLGSALYYFYRPLANKLMVFIVLLTGIWVWLGARQSYHIGASGLIYGLSSFLFMSGLIRRESRLMALSLIVVFLYGGMIWGIFPQFYPGKNISWEGHLSGLIAGLVLAVFYRKEGPQRRLYSWEMESDEEEEPEAEEELEEGEKPYWDVPVPDKKDLTVVYRFRPARKNKK